ncbi:MAG: hypothetical protein LAT84_01465 [Balneolia bacterium]|nr:hypothetical protein [Balneolia bacterium]
MVSCSAPERETDQITNEVLAPVTAFSISDFSFTGQVLDISGETDNARATTWNPDGSRMFITGRYSENVVAYDMVEPWDITTASYAGEYKFEETFSESTGLSVGHGLFIREDGSRMWVFNRTEIRHYDLLEPWNLETASFTQLRDLSDFVQRGHDFDFKEDGTVLFIDDRNAQAVHQMILETPWDIATASHVFTLDISDVEQEVRGLEVILDGTIMLLLDTVRHEVLQYELSEPWNLSTAVLHNYLDVSDQTKDPRGISISTDLSTVFITGRNEQEVYTFRR